MSFVNRAIHYSSRPRCVMDSCPSLPKRASCVGADGRARGVCLGGPCSSANKILDAQSQRRVSGGQGRDHPSLEMSELSSQTSLWKVGWCLQQHKSMVLGIMNSFQTGSAG